MELEHPVAREMWSDPERFEAEVRLEATTKSFMKTLLGMVAAHRTLVHKYLSGAADAAAEEAGREANQPAAVAAGPARRTIGSIGSSGTSRVG